MTKESYFTGKRVLVTGASTGIGLAIVRRFAKAGATVGMHHRRPKQTFAEEMATLKNYPGKVETFRADFLEAENQDKPVIEFVKRFGGIDILVNNAGTVFDYGDFSTLSHKSWTKTFAVNADAPFFLCRAAWPHMLQQESGRIINISTASVGYSGSVQAIHYIASKAALEAFSMTLAKEGVRQGILVNVVRCGVIATDMHRHIDGYDDSLFRDRVKLIPAGRMGKPEEIAETVLFLASEHSAFISGQILTVAGGD